MQFSRANVRLVAPLVGLALGVTACSGGSGGTSTSAPTATGGSATASGNPGAVVTVNGTEPQNGLLPANTNETGGGRILQQLFTGLVSYDEKGNTVNEVAESITTNDSRTYTVKIKPGWKFTNGEAITAQTFVDTWNFGALSTNNQLNSSFFDPIQGYDEVHPEDPTPDDTEDALPKPKAQTMSGLKVVDPSTFTITLAQPSSTFPQRLGYSAFYPLPSAALQDPKTYGENPVGNGPYKLDGKWEHKVQIKTVANPDYQGTKKPRNGGILNKFYTTLEAGYADLQADKLDVLDEVPDAALETFQTDLGDRAVNQPAGIFQSFSFPLYDKKFQGPNAAKVRTAISLAIDRDTITKQIFFGTRTPAKDFSSPVVEGYDETICGELCTFNPQRAQQLLAEAGGLPGGKLEIGYNADGGHQGWVDATCNSIRNTLKIECTGKATPLFADFREAITKRKVDQAFRTGWQMDYPALDNFLFPIYSTGASSNDSGYSNKDFDRLLQEGYAAPTVDAGIGKFKEAERLLVRDVPAIPLWYSNNTAGYAKTVSNVKFDVFSVPVYTDITKS